jgi:signal peptidase II
VSTTPAQADPTATPDQVPDQGPVHTPAKYALFGVVAVIFTVADQASKIWVRGNLAEHRDELQIIPGFLSFIHAENPGAAFSLLRDSEYRLYVFGAFTVLAVLMIGNMVRTLPARERFLNVAFALVMSGAVGNAIDRVVQGTVTDFIRMYTEAPGLKSWLIAQVGTAEWPTYNIADIAIVVGLAMVAFHSLVLDREGQAAAAPAPSASPPAASPPAAT